MRAPPATASHNRNNQRSIVVSATINRRASATRASVGSASKRGYSTTGSSRALDAKKPALTSGDHNSARMIRTGFSASRNKAQTVRNRSFSRGVTFMAGGGLYPIIGKRKQ